ncbi:peptidase M15-like protein [Chromohalobacter marismortui]|uniref:Peptidase M15-like protein n=1 Tax=Chromohalobacter marismortui TaxID=42055 RepID=A0A4R7NQ82_9GAMM|nr:MULTISPECIES: D-Ala-D-Ala carboxypeptidase family metallohydrolase [Chromohalobacter]MCI0508604.1 D-Ala-D-Ala carboxypeptidase family metallohydrolase [Chromohalobacter sp.]TDU23083.1 peptidase M15-like protein [Chromohalobacter marismortui]
MTRISPNFQRHEFACSCGCGFDTVDSETLAVLEEVRGHFDTPVIVTSGCRCPEYNAQIGGAEHSQHKLGRAADIQVKGVDPGEVHAYLVELYPGRYGIGRYDTFTHVDTRTDGPARWNG